MTNETLRKLAVQLLDDDDGINESAWDTLSEALEENGELDILQAVDAADERFYLPEGRAARLLGE